MIYVLRTDWKIDDTDYRDGGNLDVFFNGENGDPRLVAEINCADLGPVAAHAIARRIASANQMRRALGVARNFMRSLNLDADHEPRQTIEAAIRAADAKPNE